LLGRKAPFTHSNIVFLQFIRYIPQGMREVLVMVQMLIQFQKSILVLNVTKLCCR